MTIPSLSSIKALPRAIARHSRAPPHLLATQPRHRRFNALLDADVDGVEDFVAIEGHDPVQLTNVFHPSNTTLTVAPANAAHLSTFGIDWGREGQSGFSAPFSWSG